MKTFGVYVGRFNPIHNGHEQIIRALMDQFGPERSVIILGSCNSSFSMRHFFSYEERRQFILSIFPEARLIGIPDYASDPTWLMALDDLLTFGGIDPRSTTYYGGSVEDVCFFIEDGRNCQIIERFEGKMKDISATRVRDCLIHGRSQELDLLLNPSTKDLIVDTFTRKWEEFKKI